MFYHMFLPYTNNAATPSGEVGWGHGMMWEPFGYNMMGGQFGLFGWLMGILSFLTWILLIVAVVVFIRWMWRKGEK